MLRLDDVELRVGARTVLAPTTLEVSTGARLALVGGSGAGKSTLLRLVLGLARPTSGRIVVLGRVLDPASCDALRLRIGYVVQEGGLFPHLTAGEGASIVARYARWTREHVRERLAELAALVGVPAEHLARYPFQLSGGQRQRIGLIRALMLDPDLLLFDEPFAALDPISSARLEDDLLEVIDALGRTLLFVTHDVGQASRVGHDIAVLHEGRILQRGTYDELSRSPAHPFVAELLRAHRAPARLAAS